MKKTKLFISALLALLICMCMSPAFAVGNVTYKGKADGVIFKPGTEEAPTDLFASFKGVMPGDMLEETIEVRNDAPGEIKIYMRALGVGEEGRAFLAQMNLKVNHSTDSELFNAAADQITGLEDWVLLGTLASSGHETLDLELEVPITMGNEFQNAKGLINWEFKVEDFSVYTEETPNKETPETKEDDKEYSTTEKSREEGKEGGILGGKESGSGGTGSGSTGKGLLGGLVKTGDESKIAFWSCGIMLGIMGVFTLFKKSRSKEN